MFHGQRSADITFLIVFTLCIYLQRAMVHLSLTIGIWRRIHLVDCVVAQSDYHLRTQLWRIYVAPWLWYYPRRLIVGNAWALRVLVALANYVVRIVRDRRKYRPVRFAFWRISAVSYGENMEFMQFSAWKPRRTTRCFGLANWMIRFFNILIISLCVYEPCCVQLLPATHRYLVLLSIQKTICMQCRNGEKHSH